MRADRECDMLAVQRSCCGVVSPLLGRDESSSSEETLDSESLTAQRHDHQMAKRRSRSHPPSPSSPAAGPQEER